MSTRRKQWLPLELKEEKSKGVLAEKAARSGERMEAVLRTTKKKKPTRDVLSFKCQILSSNLLIGGWEWNVLVVVQSQTLGPDCVGSHLTLAITCSVSLNKPCDFLFLQLPRWWNGWNDPAHLVGTQWQCTCKSNLCNAWHRGSASWICYRRRWCCFMVITVLTVSVHRLAKEVPSHVENRKTVNQTFSPLSVPVFSD